MRCLPTGGRVPEDAKARNIIHCALPYRVKLEEKQMTTSGWQRTAIAVLAVCVLNMGMTSAAQAGIVSTGAIVHTERDANLASIRGQLDRSEVRAQMQKMGVDPMTVDQRIASLSDGELAQMATQMQKAPAGGDGVLIVIGLVFLVLMILEFVGVIDVFKRA
jgi:hypothetical protein